MSCHSSGAAIRRLCWVRRRARAPDLLLASDLKTLSDGRDIRDVTGGDDGSGQRDESVDQLLELVVVEGVVGGQSEGVGAVLDVGPYRLALSANVAIPVEQSRDR